MSNKDLTAEEQRQELEYRDGMGSVALDLSPAPAAGEVVSHANALSETEWREQQKAKHPDKADFFEPASEVGITKVDFGAEAKALAKEAGLELNVVEPNNDEVICPHCTHQFRAIPVNIQNALGNAGYEPPYLVPYAGVKAVMEGKGVWSVPIPVADALQRNMLQQLNQQDLGARVYATIAAALRYSEDIKPGKPAKAPDLQKMRALMLTALRDIKSVYPAIVHGPGEGQDLTDEDLQ